MEGGEYMDRNISFKSGANVGFPIFLEEILYTDKTCVFYVIV